MDRTFPVFAGTVKHVHPIGYSSHFSTLTLKIKQVCAAEGPSTVWTIEEQFSGQKARTFVCKSISTQHVGCVGHLIGYEEEAKPLLVFVSQCLAISI